MPAGTRRYVKKVFQGYQSSGDKDKHPEGVEKVMIIDRQNNRYDETVIDQKTGLVTRDIHEPLSEHVSMSKKR